jgi:hypothetical protein
MTRREDAILGLIRKETFYKIYFTVLSYNINPLSRYEVETKVKFQIFGIK